MTAPLNNNKKIFSTLTTWVWLFLFLRRIPTTVKTGGKYSHLNLCNGFKDWPTSDQSSKLLNIPTIKKILDIKILLIHLMATQMRLKKELYCCIVIFDSVTQHLTPDFARVNNNNNNNRSSEHGLFHTELHESILTRPISFTRLNKIKRLERFGRIRTRSRTWKRHGRAEDKIL